MREKFQCSVIKGVMSSRVWRATTNTKMIRFIFSDNQSGVVVDSRTNIEWLGFEFLVFAT